jgi:chromosomal replication initiator protein
VLHGTPGTGKSRLNASFVAYVNTLGSGLTAQVVSAGDVARSPDESLSDSELRDCDILALEDIQHLPERAADRACDLLDQRTAHRRSTIITASAGPAQLSHLPQRLTSRLAAGLVIHLRPLTTASRHAILAATAKEKNVPLTEDAIAWLAEQPTSGGVRATLGLLQNLAQVADTFPGPLTRDDVERVLAQHGQLTPDTSEVSRIISRVANAFAISEKELLGESRLRAILRPRQVAMYLARELTTLSLPRLGTAFGGRDHTTVLHACRKVEAEIRNNATLAQQVRDLQASLA